jgi:anti-sigma factor ChrR (cupin superfamily)
MNPNLVQIFGSGRFDPGNAWQELRPGVEIHRFYGTGEAGPSAALLRYEPGANVPAHRHTGYEHILVLEGSQSDDNDTYTAGQCLISPPGSSHSVSSATGCLVFAVWESPVEFL